MNYNFDMTDDAAEDSQNQPSFSEENSHAFEYEREILPKDYASTLPPDTPENIPNEPNAPALTAEKIATDIFLKTKIPVSEDDPMVKLALYIDEIFFDAKADLKSFLHQQIQAGTAEYKHNQARLLTELDNKIASANDAIIERQNNVNHAFDEQLIELKNILKIIEDAKAAIVADIWKKISEHINNEFRKEITKEINTIAKNANNEVNKQKNILLGAMGGIMLGFVLFFVFAMFLR